MKSKKCINFLLFFFCLTSSLLAFESQIERYDFSDVKATESFKSDINNSIVDASKQYKRIEEEIRLSSEDKDTSALAQKADYFAEVSTALQANLETFTINETKYQEAISTGDKIIADVFSKNAAAIVSDAQSKISELNLNIKEIASQLGVREVSSDPNDKQGPIEQQKPKGQDGSAVDPVPEKEKKEIDFAEAKEAEEESEIIASLVDGFIESILGAVFIQWGANLYVSLSDFGYALFKLLFSDIALDWSPLAFNFTDLDFEIANAVQDGDKKLAVSDAFALLDTLQDYKVYFQNLVISYLKDGSLSLGEKNLIYREGKIVNAIEYRIEKFDVSVLDDIDDLFVNPQRISLVKSIIQGLSKKNQFPWLILNTISASKRQNNIKTISKLDLVKIMKTMQRLEGAFMAKITSLLDSEILPSENEKNTIISLANLLNSLSVKIENQDPQVFLDLATVETKIQQGIVDKGQTASEQINAMQNLILKYSWQPSLPASST